VVKEFHHRMAMILAKDDYERWLDPTTIIDDLLGLLQPWAGKLKATEASKCGPTKAEKEPLPTSRD
jgi:putative SOS response-associated peptidase YedK